MCLYFHANTAIYKILGIKYYGFFQTVVLKKALEGPVDYKEIKPVNLKVNQHWILIGKTNAEVEAPVLWPLDAKSPLIGKDSDAGGDWRQEKGETEDEMAGWYHWFNGHGLGQTLRSDEGLGSLVCCSALICKELDMTWWLNNNYRSLHEKGQDDVTCRDTAWRVMWRQRQRLDTCSPKPRNSQEYQWPKTKNRHGKKFFPRASKSEAETLISTFWPPQLWGNKFLLI